MRNRGHDIFLLVVVALLLTLLYPALFLGYRLAPEASLKGEAPWRSQLGPYPKPSGLAVEAATHLGPRLASLSRDGMSVALWNPWIGGGRPGWLSSPAEGGAPLPVLAGLLARRGSAWTALAAMELTLAFATAWWVLRALALSPWPAAVGATAYALSGPVVGHWLDWQGSALALGPLALVPPLTAASSRARAVARWACVLALLVASGASVVPFVALAAAVVILSRPLLGRPQSLVAPLAAIALVTAMAMPALWLHRSGVEAGAPAPATFAGAPLHGFRALVAPATADTTTGHQSGVPASYLGAATLLLAVLGAFRLPARDLGLWLAALAACTALAVAPEASLARLGISQRPLGVLALAVAVLAAHGCELLCTRAPTGGVRQATGCFTWLLVTAALIPNAARALPFATAEDADLPSPVSLGPAATATRIAAVLGMLRPDVCGTLGLADVRAASFSGEPRYAALLGPGRNGELTVSRALDRRTARLGARYLLEPVALHVVSGEIFAHVEVADLPLAEHGSPDGLRRTPVAVPAGACRLGLPAASNTTDVWIEAPRLRSQLEADPALVSESDAWRWFALPPEWPAGNATLALSGAGRPGGVRSVAWDASGLRLVSEENGTRLWRWDRARPLAFLATGLRSEDGPVPDDIFAATAPTGRLEALLPLAAENAGSVEVARVSPTRVDLRVGAPSEALLVVQIKHRPALWRATVDGQRIVTDRVDGVWTGIRVPGGASRVVLLARLPLLVWVPAFAAVIAVGFLGLGLRRR